MMKRRRLLILSIVITVADALLIIWFSSQPVTDSDSLSRGLAQRLLELCSIEVSAQELSFLNHILRKLAHFTVYLVLGCGLTGITSYKLQRMSVAVCAAVLLGTLFAASDEFHQFFSEGRGPSIQDVLLDACGVAVGSFKYCLFQRIIRPEA